MMGRKVSMSGSMLISLLNEIDVKDSSTFGLLFGSYELKIRQNTTDTVENNSYTESVLGISSYLSTKREYPFLDNRMSDFSRLCLSDSEIQSVVGFFVIRRSSLICPSFREAQSLHQIGQFLKIPQPLLLVFSVPNQTDQQSSWIYSMEYRCYTLSPTEMTTPVLELVDVSLPSLSEDMVAEYKAVESLVPSSQFLVSTNTISKNIQLRSDYVYCESVVATVQTELLADAYLEEMKVELLKIQELEKEIFELNL